MHGEKESPGSSERKDKRVRIVMIVAGLATVVTSAFWLLFDWRSAEERLAEFEAARATPNAENAATIYSELLQDPSVASLDEIFWDSAAEGAFNRAAEKPWRAEECPEIAAWIAKYAHVIDKLVEASQFDQCRFPISLGGIDDLGKTHRDGAMSSWECLLLCAINNDIGEERIDDAIAKWHCLIQMANHQRQQPWETFSVAGHGVESIVRFIVTENPSEAYLRQIEALPLPVANDWPQRFQEIRVVEDLRARKELEPLGLWEQIRFRYSSYRFESKFADFLEGYDPRISYLEFVAEARAIRILVAAKRHAYKTGHWPNSLDELKSSLSPEILTDPLSGGPFVYTRTGDSFRLYSRGKNKIDEDGQWKLEGPDDHPIWPPRGAELGAQAGESRRAEQAEDAAPETSPQPPADESDEEMMKKLAEIYGDRYDTGKPEDGNGV